MKMYKPTFQPTTHLYKLLEQISAVRERVQTSLIKVPWVPSLVIEARAKLAWGSTAIEGCTLSLEAIQGLLEGKEAVGYPGRHVQMAKNYIKALSWIQKWEKHTIVKEADIFKLHAILAEGAIDEGPIGAYRRRDVRAGLHIAPHWKGVQKLMQALLVWLNESAKQLPAVFSSAILHLRFVEIHPFRDGNGRLARLLATWELYRKGFDLLHIFAMDEVLFEHREFYIKNLQRVQVEKEDLSGWLEFIAETVLETLERIEKRIMAIGTVDKKPMSLTMRQEKLLNILREKGQLSISEIASALKITVPGTHYVMKPLLQYGLVTKLGSHKQTRYVLTSRNK
jgi:Fic family protein